MTSENKLTNICCPTCNQSHTWTANNKARPFCSDRCKLIDLGEWASESRKIASQPIDELVDLV